MKLFLRVGLLAMIALLVGCAEPFCVNPFCPKPCGVPVCTPYEGCHRPYPYVGCYSPYPPGYFAYERAREHKVVPGLGGALFPSM